MQRERSIVCGMENGVQHGTPINCDYLAESLGLVQLREAPKAGLIVRQYARHMSHFATGARLRLAVEPQRRALVPQNGLVIEDVFADEVAHFDLFAMAPGRS